jgi:hypothetical protein
MLPKFIYEMFVILSISPGIVIFIFKIISLNNNNIVLTEHKNI